MLTLDELENRLVIADNEKEEYKRKVASLRVKISRYKKAIENLHQLELFEKEENETEIS